MYLKPLGKLILLSSNESRSSTYADTLILPYKDFYLILNDSNNVLGNKLDVRNFIM
jgi:hypothetical protein